MTLEDIGADDGGVRGIVDAAYRATSGGGVEQMVGDAAAGTTLRLSAGSADHATLT